MIKIPQKVVNAEEEDEGRDVSVLQATNEEEIPLKMETEDFRKGLGENENPIAFDETPSNADSGNELDYYLKYFFINGNLKRKENDNLSVERYSVSLFFISYIQFCKVNFLERKLLIM